MEDKTNKLKFYQEIFLVADTKFKVILKIFFLKINNINILFGKEILIWKSYITNKALSIIKQVQIIDLKEFVMMALNTDNKIFVVYMVI